MMVEAKGVKSLIFYIPNDTLTIIDLKGFKGS
jgi:hypothetical protein